MQKISDTTPSKYRLWYNDWVEHNANGAVLDIGKSSQYDYGFTTIDISHNADIIADICDSKLKTNSYDTILCNGMFEWVDDPQAMVNEISRLLRPGGNVIFGFVGEEYPPYRKPWKFYDNNIVFGTLVRVGAKNFNKEYYFLHHEQTKKS